MPEAPAAPAPVAAEPKPGAAAPVTPAAPAPAAVAPKPGEPAAPQPKTGSLLENAQKPEGAPPKPGEPKPGDAPQGAPETYADFTLPEGMTPDKALLEKAVPLFKELGLSQEKSQKLVTLQAEYAKSSMEALVAQSEKLRTEQIATWQSEVKKELGADWEKELGHSARALDAFWPPEFRKLLTQSGFGDHPDMIRGLIKLGKQLGETKPGDGSRVPVNDPKEQTNRTMFPKMYDANGNYIGGSAPVR